MPVKTDSKKAIAIMNRAGLKPLEVYGGNIKPWKSKHLKCGRIVYPTLNAIKRGQGPCKYCAGKAVYPPDAVKLFLNIGLKPLEPYPGDNKKPWKCIHLTCGNEVSPKYAIVARGESMGCHHCSDQFVDPDAAYQFYLSKNLQPLVPYPGTNKPWRYINSYKALSSALSVTRLSDQADTVAENYSYTRALSINSSCGTTFTNDSSFKSLFSLIATIYTQATKVTVKL